MSINFTIPQYQEDIIANLELSGFFLDESTIILRDMAKKRDVSQYKRRFFHKVSDVSNAEEIWDGVR